MVIIMMTYKMHARCDSASPKVANAKWNGSDRGSRGSPSWVRPEVVWTRSDLEKRLCRFQET